MITVACFRPVSLDGRIKQELRTTKGTSCCSFQSGGRGSVYHFGVLKATQLLQIEVMQGEKLKDASVKQKELPAMFSLEKSDQISFIGAPHVPRT
jgi:hypothetical protein